MPSNGVGTGFAREVLERLAQERHGQVFDPASLTEDYEIGVYIHAKGYRQTFAPLTRGAHGFVATREFFPRSTRAAIRQRTRWITGIALQCWERHGWRGSWSTRYWFWRDRKGLLTNPLSAFANLVFIWGVLDYCASLTFHRPWRFTVESPLVAALCATTLAIQWCRVMLRSLCVFRVFGRTMAMGVLFRSFHANLINCVATFCAVRTYIAARRRKRALTWLKTEHAYPSREKLHGRRRDLKDVLVGSGLLSEDQLVSARASLEEGAALDLLALARTLVGEEQLCKAISLQSGFPYAAIDRDSIDPQMTRILPAQLQREYGVMPFAVRAGTLLVATTAVPSDEIVKSVTEASELSVEFQLVTHSAYKELCGLL